MKTAMKKALSLSLVLILLLSVFPMAAFATETGEDIAVADAAAAVPAAEESADADVAPAADAAVVPAAEGAAPAADVPAADVPAADAGSMLPSEEDQGFAIPEGEGEAEQEPAALNLDTDENSDNLETAAHTSLTVNFYVDNNLAQTATHNAAASVQDLINACCTVDDSQTVYYSGARVDSTPYELSDVVALGQEVHIYLYTQSTTPAPAPTPDPAPTVCSVCSKEVINGMCTGCYLDEADCACAQATTPDDNAGKVTLIVDPNFKGAKKSYLKVEPNAKIIDLIAGIPAPTRDGHMFSHWTLDAAGWDYIEEEVVTDRGVTIYAQWDDNLAIGGNITVHINLNYDHKMGEDVTNIKKGTEMGDILDYVTEPTRYKHKFVGWYWDKDCDERVTSNDRVYRDCTIYAKWERRKTDNEIMLKVFLNGNTKSVAKLIDMYEYSKDGRISISEVKEAVGKYYTAKHSDGMSFSGLFYLQDDFSTDWSDYVSDPRHTKGEKRLDVKSDDDTTICVMVYNAKVRSSSSSGTADTTNPKTGDMIFTAVTVMGASAACLATLFYLNKKKRTM